MGGEREGGGVERRRRAEATVRSSRDGNDSMVFENCFVLFVFWRIGGMIENKMRNGSFELFVMGFSAHAMKAPWVGLTVFLKRRLEWGFSAVRSMVKLCFRSVKSWSELTLPSTLIG